MIIKFDFEIGLDEYESKGKQNEFPVFERCPNCNCISHGNLLGTLPAPRTFSLVFAQIVSSIPDSLQLPARGEQSCWRVTGSRCQSWAGGTGDSMVRGAELGGSRRDGAGGLRVHGAVLPKP